MNSGVDAWGAVWFVRRGGERRRRWISYSVTNGLKGIQRAAGEGGSPSSSSVSGAHWRGYSYKPKAINRLKKQQKKHLHRRQHKHILWLHDLLTYFYKIYIKTFDAP